MRRGPRFDLIIKLKYMQQRRQIGRDMCELLIMINISILRILTHICFYRVCCKRTSMFALTSIMKKNQSVRQVGVGQCNEQSTQTFSNCICILTGDTKMEKLCCNAILGCDANQMT